MQEYRDGSFGEPKKLKEKLSELMAMNDETVGKIKALHIGTPEELEEIKQSSKNPSYVQLDLRINKLEKKINKVMIHLGIDNKTEILKI